MDNGPRMLALRLWPLGRLCTRTSGLPVYSHAPTGSLGYNSQVSAPTWLRATGVFLVILYLCCAGWFFILAPWSRLWSSQVVPGAPWWLMTWLESPALRGALSGFGVLHFAVAVSWVAPRRRTP